MNEYDVSQEALKFNRELEFDGVGEILSAIDNELTKRTKKDNTVLRSSFWEFCKYMDSKFFIDEKPKLKEIADILQDVADGKLLYVLINVTVRTGKSYMLTMFCAFSYGRNPTLSILRVTSVADLFEAFSSDLQKIIMSEKYQKVFPEIQLKEGKKAIKRWALTTSKQYAFFGGGIDKAIVGFGGEMLVVDDPHKGITEAYNDNAMDKVYRIYNADLKSRLDPNKQTPIIILHTKWNSVDLTGRLQTEQGLASLNGSKYDEDGVKYTGKWHKYAYPALMENDKSFDEKIWSTEKLLQERKEKIRGGEEDLWNLMFQQDVVSVDKRERLFPKDDLKYFKRNHLKEYLQKSYDADYYPKVKIIIDPADSGSNNLAALFYMKVGQFYYIVDVIYTHIELGNTYTDMAFGEKITKHSVKSFMYEKDGIGNVFSKLLVAKMKELFQIELKSKGFGTGNINKHQRILINAGKVKDYCRFLVEEERDEHYLLYMKHLYAYNRKYADKNKLDAPDVTSHLVDKKKLGNLVDAQVS